MAKQAIQNAKRGELFKLEDPWRVTIIGLDTDDDEHHPYYDTRIKLELAESFIRNIGFYGNIDAVEVCKDGSQHTEGPYKGEDRLLVIAGRQRVRAMREAVKRAKERGEVPPLLKVEVRRGSTELLQGIGISENEFKQSDTPMVRARKASRLLNTGHDEDSLANMFGVQKQTITQWLKLSELSAKVQKAVDQNLISATAAEKLHGLDKSAQAEALTKLLEHARETGKSKPTIRDAVRASEGLPGTPKTHTLLPKACIRRLAVDEPFFTALSADAQALIKVLCGDKEAIDEVPGLAERLEMTK